jgi:signal transduction histidine kinase
MIDNNNQSNEEYLQKLAKLQTNVLNIVKAETFEEMAKNVFAGIAATIDPIFIAVGQVRFGAIRGLRYRPALGIGILGSAAGGLPLDGPGIMVRAVNTRKICNIPDTRKDPSYVYADTDPESARAGTHSESHTLSEIAVPIIAQGKSIGVINIEEAEVNAFNESDQKIIEVLSGYAGASLSNILYANRLNGLHKYTSQLSTLTSIDEIAKQTLDAMTETLELESCVFLIPQEGAIYEKRLEESIQIRKKAIQSFQFGRERWREVEDIKFLSKLDVPVNVDKEVVAVITAKSIQPDKYTDQDKKLLEVLASHVASAIQRIRLEKEQITRAQKLEALNKDLEREVQIRKEYEKEIIRVARESEVDKLRSQFLSTITHELRTPLTSIKGYVEVIRSGWVGEVSPEMNDTLDIIMRNTDRLSTLTSDLLDVQRIATGRLEVNQTNIDLKDVIKQSIKEINPVIAEKKQKLELKIPEDPLTITGDSQRLNQVLMNLLNNASKFSKEKTTIYLKVEKDKENIFVSVKDSGIGIKEADLDRVFTPLAMIEKPVYVKGTGLGLSISKGIIDLHNGEIWAESEGEWKGATFTIKLPRGGEL